MSRLVERVVVKRNNPTLTDSYGHWWVEIDGAESYGWWPSVRSVTLLDALRGVPGVLNRIGGPGDGTPTVDPRHGELADHAFHPVTDGDGTDEEVIAAIRQFVATFEGEWRWSTGPAVNCRSFQLDLLVASGLAVPDGYNHSAGGGCPFLAPARRWSAWLRRMALRSRFRPTRARIAGPHTFAVVSMPVPSSLHSRHPQPCRPVG